jgi:hypothetical protein
LTEERAILVSVIGMRVAREPAHTLQEVFAMPVTLMILILMASVVLALAVYRKVVARNEDDLVHLAEGSDPLIANQQKTEHSLSLIDRAGKLLTVATVLYGVVLAAGYLYVGLTKPSL